MTAERDLSIDAMLWAAAPAAAKDASDRTELEVLIIAWFLDLLSQKEGLSEEARDPLRKRMAMPAEVTPFLSHFFTDLYDEEHLRHALYTHVTPVAAALQSPQDARDLLGITQVLWALSYDVNDRPDLPLKGGRYITVGSATGEEKQKAWIGTDELDGDFARLPRSDRADLARGILSTSGSGLRRRGARIAVLLARHILTTTPGEKPELGLTSIHVEGNKRSIRLQSATPPPRRRSVVASPRLQPDQMQTVQAMVDRMRFLAEALPHSNQAPLAATLLIAGVESFRAEQYTKAMSEFDEAAQISETLAALNPEDTEHRVRLTLSVLMNAAIRVLSGNSATDHLRRAASLAQDLADSDDEYAIIQALALILNGVFALQLDEPDDARRALSRAVTICTKISRRGYADKTFAVLLAGSLVGLAGSDFASGLFAEAGTSITQALTLSAELFAVSGSDLEVRLLRATTQQMAISIFHELERDEDALAAAASAVEITQDLLDDDPTSVSAQYLLGASLVGASWIYITLDRYEEALAWVTDAAVLLEQVERRNSDPTLPFAHIRITPMIATLFLIRGVLFRHFEKAEDAEAALLRAARLGESEPDPDGRTAACQAFGLLAQIYRETGRESLAQHSRARANALAPSLETKAATPSSDGAIVESEQSNDG